MTYHKLMNDIEFRESLEEMYNMGLRHGRWRGMVIGIIIAGAVLALISIWQH